MTERRHELTDEDIAELVARARKYPCRVFDEAEIAALPSRQPKDPDTGLGVTWELAEKYSGTAMLIDGEMAALVYDSDENGGKYNQAAVARAILAAPKAIKLARDIASVNHPGYANLKALASEVLAIVDGKEERS